MFCLLATVLALVRPVNAAPQVASHPDSTSFVFQVGHPFHLAASDRLGGLILIGDTAQIDGTVGQLVVVDGVARIRGTVIHDVVVVRGRLELVTGAAVEQDVMLYRSAFTRGPGTRVGGVIHEQAAMFRFGRRFFLFIWVSMTIAVLVAGIAFATFGAVQLVESAALLRRDVRHVAVAVLVLWVGVPLAAVVVMSTGIGAPLGIGIVLVLLPGLWFVGFLVTGTSIGGTLLRWGGRPQPATSPYLPTVVGLAVLQVIGLVPGFGGLIGMLAGLAGAGAIAARSWAVRRETRSSRVQLGNVRGTTQA